MDEEQNIVKEESVLLTHPPAHHLLLLYYSTCCSGETANKNQRLVLHTALDFKSTPSVRYPIRSQGPPLTGNYRGGPMSRATDNLIN